jgi:hypothetical protein
MTAEGGGAVEVRGGSEDNGGGGDGRYLVAGRDLAAGEVVLSEYPLVAGPIYTRTRPVCLECLRWVDAGAYRCAGCRFPLCGEACRAGSRHQLECKIFQALSTPHFFCVLLLLLELLFVIYSILALTPSNYTVI